MPKINLLLVNGVDRKRDIIRSEIERFPEFSVVHECRGLSEAFQFIEQGSIDVLCLSPVLRWQLKFLGRSGQRVSVPVVYIDWYAEIHILGANTFQNTRRKQYFQAVREKICSMISMGESVLATNESQDIQASTRPASFILIAGPGGDFDTTRSVIADLHQANLPVVVAQKLNSCFAYHYEKQLDQITTRKISIAKDVHHLNSEEILLVLLDKKFELISTDTGVVLTSDSRLKHEQNSESEFDLLENLLRSTIICPAGAVVIFMPEIVCRYSGIIKQMQAAGIQTICIKPWKQIDRDRLIKADTSLVAEMVPVHQLRQQLASSLQDRP